MPEALHLAVLGDVHGNLTLAFRVLRRWERETGHRLDLALQVGDLGAFPPPFRLDKATKRFAEKDPDELGFADYYEGDPDAEEVFGEGGEGGRSGRQHREAHGGAPGGDGLPLTAIGAAGLVPELCRVLASASSVNAAAAEAAWSWLVPSGAEARLAAASPPSWRGRLC